MKGVVRWAILGGVGLSWLALGGGLPAAAPSVTVEYAPPHLTVRISEATDLHTVLTAVCAQTRARCELAAPAAAVPVGPTTVEGLWAQAVLKLLQGSGLIYALLPPGPDGEARLVVEGPGAPHGVAPAGEPRNFSSLMRSPAPATTLSVPEGGATSGESSAGEAAPGTGPDLSVPGLFEHLGRAAQTPEAAAPTHFTLPFPDSEGNPVVVPISNEPLTVFPFPGPDGQPVPVPPNPGPLTVFPFPGPDGQPVPIPPTVRPPGPGGRVE